ncbi:MAG: hypothetical protein MZW92_49790 [Comamonadaceae bacterium]|nr:hypothetical protein [Comamonadaceae bacterium]
MRRVAGGAPAQRAVFSVREPYCGRGLRRAWLRRTSRALAAVSRDIAQAIRELRAAP